MHVYSAIARALADHGVDTIFGLMGEANMHIIDHLVNNHGGRYIASPREDGGILAAMGYHHATGRLGVASVTHGPALTNASTALVEAVRNHAAIVVVAGDTELAERGNLQDIGQREVVAPTGAGFVHVRTAETALEDLGLAIRRATSESRPIVLNVPADIQMEEVEYAPPRYSAVVPQAVQPDPEALDRAVGMIASARRPIVLAGWGAVVSDAREPLQQLAERLGAPVATTLKAKHFFRGDPFDLGIFGTFSHPVAGEVIAGADLIIAFGASLNRFTGANGAYLEDTPIVHVDTSPQQIGDWTPVSAPVVGDASAVALAIIEWLDQIEHKPTAHRSPELEERLKSREPESEFEDGSTATTVDPRTFVLRANGRLPGNRNVVTDAGHFVMAPLQYLDVEHPRKFLYPLAFGSVGLGLGSAIGMAAGRPDVPTVLTTGDGGLMMSLAEFNTAVRYGLDLIVLVLNDGGYGAEYHNYLREGMDPSLSLLDWPDFAPVAEALGGQGVTVRSLEDVDAALAAIEARDRPILVDVKMDPALRTGFFD